MKRVLIRTISIVLLLSLLTSCATGGSESVLDLLDMGEKYLLEGNYEKAVLLFLKVIKLDPLNPRGYTGSVEAYLALGETEKALAILTKGAEALPENASIQELLSHNYQPAPEILARAEESLLEHDYKQAVEQFLLLAEADPNNPRAYTGAAEAYLELAQRKQAIEMLLRGYLLTGDSGILNMMAPMAYEMQLLAEEYLQQMDFEQAARLFLILIEMDPMFVRGYTGAAEAYIHLGQLDQAIKILEEGSEITENNEIAVMINKYKITPIATEIESLVETVIGQIQGRNFEAAIATLHSGQMISFLKGEDEGHYFHSEKIWDEDKNEVIELYSLSLHFHEGDEYFPESVGFFIFIYRDGNEEDADLFTGDVDSVISMGGKTSVLYSVNAGDEEYVYNLLDIIGSH